MLTKLNKILLGLLGVQLLLVIVVMSRGGDTVSLAEQPVLAGVDAASVTRVQMFADGGDKAKIDLVKRGNDWVLGSHFDYPVIASKVTDLLAPIVKMSAAEPAATSSARHKQLRVGDTDFDRKLVLTAGGKDTIVYVGGSAGLRRTAVRVGGSDDVYGVAGVATTAMSAQGRDWVKSPYYEVPVDQVQRVTIARGAQTFEIARAPMPAPVPAGSGSGSAGSGSAAPAVPPPPKDDSPWRITIDGTPLVPAAGELFDTQAINGLVGDVATIAANPADPKREASTPTATITVHRKDGADVFTIVADNDSYWIKQTGLDRATLVEKSGLEKVVGIERAKLVMRADQDPGKGSGAPQIPGLPPGLELPQ